MSILKENDISHQQAQKVGRGVEFREGIAARSYQSLG